MDLSIARMWDTVKTDNQSYLRGNTVFRFMPWVSQTGKVRQGWYLLPFFPKLTFLFLNVLLLF